MAEETETSQDKKKGPGKLGTGIIVVMLVAIAVGLISDNDEPPNTDSSGTQFNADAARLEEQRQRERRQQLAGERSTRPSGAGDLDPFAAMSAMTRRQEMLEQQLSEANSRLESAEGSAEELVELKRSQARLERQLQDLTTMLRDDASRRRQEDRRQSASLNDESNDLAFELEGGLSESEMGSDDSFSVSQPRQKPVSPYGENYIVLSRSGGNPILAQNDPFSPTTATTARGDGLFDPQDGLKANNPFSDEGESQQSTRNTSQSTASSRGMTPEYANVKAGYAGNTQSTRSGSGSATLNDQGKQETQVPVPAFSFVEAETLHGLDCPIGADLPRTSEANAGGVTPGSAQPMPVVLPLRGKIKGPNGNIVDLGTAHVMGWCIGKRVDRGKAGRAYIKVESISFWDRKGEPQYLNTISGDVISLRDNHRGIQAQVDEVRRSYLGKQASAAALAAAATQMTQAQFTETRNPEGGVDRVFDGDRATALAGQGGAAAFNQIAALLNEEASMAYDVVRVPSGAPVRILFMAPFEVTNLKLEIEDEILDAYDILI